MKWWSRLFGGGASASPKGVRRQVWMTANLNVSAFRNGDPIPEARTNAEWEAAFDAGHPAWCNYDNKSENGEKFGKLYNWHAVNDPRGLAPEGWHVPIDAEVMAFAERLGGAASAGARMKSTSGWAKDGNGTDTEGFTGLPGGVRGSGGEFLYLGGYGTWWTATQGTVNAAWQFGLSSYNGELSRGMSHKQDGFSVRCIRD